MKILFAATRWPWPARRGNELRAAQWIEALAETHQVTLLAPRRATAEAPELAGLRVVPTRREGLSAAWGLLSCLVSGAPFQTGLYRSRSFARALRAEAPHHDLQIAQLVRLAPFLADFGPSPLWVDLVDSLSLNFAQRAEFDAPWKGPALALEARRLLAMERRFIDRAVWASVVCDRDRADLGRRLETRLSARLGVVPLAIPLGQQHPTVAGDPFILLSGNLGYFPTVDGARWFLGGPWPEIRRRHPAVRCVFAGARPPRGLAAAARRAGIEVVADPQDLAPLVAGATISIAPARAGSGVSIKVLEAWAAGTPVVASTFTAAGAALESGVEGLIADSPREWVEAIDRLLTDTGLAASLAAAGRRRVEKDNAPSRVAELVRRTAGELAAGSV